MGDFDNDENQTAAMSLTDREKYRTIIPLLTNIGNLVCCYPTEHFFRYLNEFKEIENLIRKGKSLLATNEVVPLGNDGNEGQESIPEHIVDDLSQEVEVEINSIEEIGETLPNDNSPPPGNDQTSSSSIAIPNPFPSSKFKLKFKDSLKSKG